MVRTPAAALALLALAALVCLPAFSVPGGFVSGDAWRDNDWLNTRAFDAMSRQAVLEHGQIPLRNPLVGGGYPTIAHPSDGSWAPTLLPVLAFGVEGGTKINLVLLLLLGGLGMFLLARDVGGLDPPAALFAGALLIVSGWLPSMLLVGFWNQIFALLGPLVLWAVLSETDDRRRPLLGGLVLALVLQQGGTPSPRSSTSASRAWSRGPRSTPDASPSRSRRC